MANPQQLAQVLAAINPSTAGNTRSPAPSNRTPVRDAGLTGHGKGTNAQNKGQVRKAGPSGAKGQALANLASRRRVGVIAGSAVRNGAKAKLGKTLPATVGLADNDADDQ